MLWFFVLYASFLLGLSFAKSAGFGLPFLYALEASVGGDKALHFSLALVLGLLGQWAAWRVIRLSHCRRMVLVFVLLALGLLVDEMHQYFIASRRFDWGDVVWGSGGLLLGTALFVCVLFLLRVLGSKKV